MSTLKPETLNESPSPKLPVELRQATILFCDIAQSTRYASVLGEVQYGELLQHYQREAKRTVEKCLESCSDGCEWDIRGDQLCFMAYGKDDAEDARRAVELARDLKMRWLFSDYNLQRVIEKRPPVEIMIGLHSGTVALGHFPRALQTNSKLAAEGFAISVAKRVESSARHGRSWQIMLTDATLARLKRTIPISALSREHAVLSEGLTYPVKEVIEIQPEMDSYCLDTNVSLSSYLQDVVELSPSSWHLLLLAYSQLSDGFLTTETAERPSEMCAIPENVWEAPLLTNPEALFLPMDIAAYYLLAGCPYEALAMLERARARVGDRHFSLGYYSVAKAVALLMQHYISEGSKDSILDSCRHAKQYPQWKDAAGIIEAILNTDGSATQYRPFELEGNEPSIQLFNRTMRMIADRELTLGQVDEWKADLERFNPADWFALMHPYRIERLIPLFKFLSRHSRDLKDAKREIYRFLGSLHLT